MDSQYCAGKKTSRIVVNRGAVQGGLKQGVAERKDGENQGNIITIWDLHHEVAGGRVIRRKDFRLLTIGPASEGLAPEAFLTNVSTEVAHEGTP